MVYQIKLEQFSGPLDLLLSLIQEQQLDISQVSLAKVTDQYLAYLDEHKDLPAHDLADFLTVATKLLVIKSKTLLPQLADDEEDSAEQFEAQLRMYKEYLEASKKIEAILAENNYTFTRERLPVDFRPKFSPPPKLAVSDLTSVFEEIIKRIEYITQLPEKIMQRIVSLKEMVGDIRSALLKAQKISFRDVLAKAKNKSDAVVCFMALLELIRSGEAAVNQKGIFDEIEVERI
ncbi:MAG: segregation/condensation protein A [Candidatus Buchananbacteria bacterium]